jgi:dolichol-phosphate mannosyltransferase
MQPEISIVIPVFNQGKVLCALHQRLTSMLSVIPLAYEMIFVDDGCSPPTQAILQDIISRDHCVLCIELKRNYGQSNAIAAGLQYAQADFVVVMDADLQDKPEDIRSLFSRITSESADLVLASRPSSNGSLCRRLASMSFYRLSNLLTTLKQPPNTGVFRIFRQELLQAVIAHEPQPGTILSRIQQSAHLTLTVETSRDLTHRSASGYTFGKLFRLAWERFIVYPRYPLPYLHSDKILKTYIPRFGITKVHQAGRND